MTFRPSDDVLDEIAAGQQPSQSMDQYNVSNQDDWQHMFGNPDNSDINWNIENNAGMWTMIDIPVEEVKAPDLSELLGNDWWNTNDSESQDSTVSQSSDSEISQVEQSVVQDDLSENTSDNFVVLNVGDTQGVSNPDSNNLNSENLNQNVQDEENHPIKTESDESEYIDLGKMPDSERSAIISSMEWWINSNLDYLVDKKWLEIVEWYKTVHRLFFRWGVFALSVLVWVLCGTLLQVKASNPENLVMIWESSISNLWSWKTKTSDMEFEPLVESGVDMKVLVPYGAGSYDWKKFITKSNLISYKGIILPQVASINYNFDGFISQEDFDNWVTREDLEDLMFALITNSSIYGNTTNLPNALDSRWIGDTFKWSLMDGFSLNCLGNDKISDFVCDKFLDNFYEYGRYYEISSDDSEWNNYSAELLNLIKQLKGQKKDVKPLCNMVKDYVLHAGVTSENLSYLMDYCGDEDSKFYKKMIDFIDIENSLWQPELSDKVYDDSDLNAYKLLSAMQTVNNFIYWPSFNENYVKSYLTYVQAIVEKDKARNLYLKPIYKDLMYVYNSDKLAPYLIKNGYTNLKLQLDQINNWNPLYINNWNDLYKYSSLIEQLTTTGIVKVDEDYERLEKEERSIEELFSPYYSMKDRLRVRWASLISWDKLRVQTELLSEKIMSITEEDTLKLTVVLHRWNNVLYVDSIIVANQPKFSEILTIYVDESNVSFPDMLSYIEEQVWMWYEMDPEKVEQKPSFCEQIEMREDISVYACDDSVVSLYKWDVEYNFELDNGILDSYTIWDEKLDQIVKERLDGILFMKDNTPTIISAIIDFVPDTEDDNLQKKMDILDQFRIHFKLIPDDIQDINWKYDDFLVFFTLWEFKLQANYNIDSHILTRISYMDCDKILEIRGLTIAVTTENESQLAEIMNNPRVFFAMTNQAAYKKYQKMCEDPKAEEKKK